MSVQTMYSMTCTAIRIHCKPSLAPVFCCCCRMKFMAANTFASVVKGSTILPHRIWMLVNRARYYTSEAFASAWAPVMSCSKVHSALSSFVIPRHLSSTRLSTSLSLCSSLRLQSTSKAAASSAPWLQAVRYTNAVHNRNKVPA